MTKKKKKQVTVGFVALGCPKNMVDSERMLAEIVQAGFLLAAEPERADVVVINTCGFIEPAKIESLEAVEQALANKKMGNVRKVIVTGCLSQRLGEPLLQEAGGVDAVVGLEHRDAIVRVIRDTLASDKPLVFHGPTPCTIADDRVRLRIGPAHSAYLRISEGCSHRCSFCTIPAIRGPFRSKPAELVLDEARELVASGVVELNIIGQDTTMYGRDLQLHGALASMLRDMEQIPDLSWIRLLYAYPTGIDDDLIRTIAASEKIVRYLDIPIQHASDRVLKAMRRPDTRDALYGLVERLRTAMSDIVLRTTVIVGFPGETQEDFERVAGVHSSRPIRRAWGVHLLPRGRHACGRDARPGPRRGQAGPVRRTDAGAAGDRVRQKQEPHREQTRVSRGFPGRESRPRLRSAVPARGPGTFLWTGPGYRQRLHHPGMFRDPGQFVAAKVVGTQDYDLCVEQI